MLQSFYDVIEDQNVITQILFIIILIKFIPIIVLALQIRQEMFPLGLGSDYHKCPRFLFWCPRFRVLFPM